MLKKNSYIFFIILVLLGVLVFNALKTFDTSIIERKLVYKPGKETFKLIPELASKAKYGSFLSSDKTLLTYYEIKGDKKSPVIVFCHGNAGNMTRNDNQNKIKFLVKQGYEVFIFDYRGFGKSSGEPDEKGLYRDLDSFVSFLNSRYKIPDDKIVLWGHSMGSAVVIEEASKRNFEGVIVEGAFTSIEDMKNYRISHKRNADPVHLFVRDYIFNHLPITQKLSSKDKIAKIKSPMLIIHSIKDEMIPVEMGEKLAKLKPDAQTYFSKTGTHCGYGRQDKVILEFLNKLSQSAVSENNKKLYKIEQPSLS